MRDYSRAGKRVVAKREILGYHKIPAGWEGTIQNEDDNVGRILVNVLWDLNGEIWPVFPSEIETL